MPPQATEHTRALWEDEQAEAWRTARNAYWERLCSLNNPKLEGLDKWYFEELPALVVERKPPHLLPAELVKLVDWKLTRGKFRPRLLDFAKSHSKDTVVAATSKAIAALPKNLSEALEPLVALKGVGPATASAVLSAADPNTPFMSDEALAVVLPPARNSSETYSAVRLENFVKLMRSKAKAVGGGFSSRDVERALWSEAARTMKPKVMVSEKKSSSSGKKRKR